MRRFDPAGLQDLIHGRARLAVLAFLTTVGAVDFVTLRDEINISDGNLSQHLKKLDEAGYVALTRIQSGGRGHTEIALTAIGREAFYAYLDNLKLLLDAVSKKPSLPKG
jgi:DNA-binding MarR family transcriptional regulator